MKTKSRRQHGVMATLLAMALLASLFGAAPAAGQVHLYNPEVWPDSGIAGEEIFGISVDYMDAIYPRPIENFEDNVPNDEQTDLAIQLTNHPASDNIPCWSPCDRISFASNRTAWDLGIVDPNGWRHSDIWVMNEDGTDKNYITYNDARDGYDLSWSPDCSQIVFCRTDNSWTSSNDDICIVDVATGEPSVQFIYTVDDDQCPDWSPVGINKIAFTGAGGVWQIFTIDPTLPPHPELTQITNFPNACQWPDWKPDGTEIAFERFTTPSSIWVVGSSAVMAIPAQATEVTDNGALPAWSPDGSKIAFCRETTAGNWDIWVMDANGANQNQLTKDPATDLHPTWSPDGTKIAFPSDRSGNWDIWVIPATPNDMHPRLAVDNDGDGDVHKVWMREIEEGHWEIWYAELFGSGPNFKVSPKQISDVDTANSVYPSIALDAGDDAHVVWIDYRNCDCPEIYYSKIEDNSGVDRTNQVAPFTDAHISDLDGIPSGRAVGFPPVGGSTVDDRTATYIEHPDIDVGLGGNVHIVWSDARDSTGTLYAGGTDPGNVYEHTGGTNWQTLTTPPLGYSALCLAVYDDTLYAGTMSSSSPSVGEVYRYNGGTSWTLVGTGLDHRVQALVVYNGDVYAGTSQNDARLYQYVLGTWSPVGPPNISPWTSWSGIRSAYVWKNWLYFGDYNSDRIGRFNGITFEEVAPTPGSCIWDFMCYQNNSPPGPPEDSLYASAWRGKIYETANGASWTNPLSLPPPDASRNIWEMEVFKNQRYFGTDWNGAATQDQVAWLCEYNGDSNYNIIWTPAVTTAHEGIISMATKGDMLFIGMGREVSYYGGAGGTGKVYAWDGTTPVTPSSISIPNNMGIGVQALLWKPEHPLVWEVYYQEQNTNARPDIAANVITPDKLISGADGKSSMCPVVAGGLGLWGSAVHFAWQDARGGAWEIYYEQHGILSGSTWVLPELVSHAPPSRERTCNGNPLPYNPGVHNSAKPDIGVDDRYVHITWMDQRDGWCGDDPAFPSNLPNPGEWVPHASHDQWEIYKVMLELDGKFFCGQGGCVKRQSDMATWRGLGRYTGPPDGYSMYPRIAVEPGDPVSNQALCTHITWHDNRWGINNWETYCIAVQSYCENPGKTDRVTTHSLKDMYPDVALDPTVSPQRAHLKWQTDSRGGFWRIYETRRIHKGDSDAEYIIAELFRDESPENISTFYLGRLYPYENITANDSIAYSFSFGLTQPGHYQFRICARDSAGYEATTDWIEGPVVVPPKVPDLVITDIWNEDSKIYYEIENIGGADAPRSDSGLYVDGKFMGFDSVKSLAPGESSIESFRDWWRCTPPDDAIKVCADYNERISESNESNNCLTEILTCPIPTRPDLVITDIWDEDSKIYYNITNTGSATAPRSDSGLYVDGEFMGFDSVKSLAPGESSIESFRDWWRCTPPDDTIKVCADYNERISESNESNNCLTEILTCPIPTRPDLVITDIWNEDSKIYYNITNTGSATASISHSGLHVDGRFRGFESVKSLAAGESSIESFLHWWRCTPPEDTIKVCADFIEQISESNEKNNCLTETWIC